MHGPRLRRRSTVLLLTFAVLCVVALVTTVSSLRYRSRLDVAAGAASRRIGELLRVNDAPQAAPKLVTVQVDATRMQRPISPLIYGVSVASDDALTATGARLNRWGGNPNTRFNWVQGSAWNAARDWEFRNYGGPSSGASSTADAFVG